MRKLLTPLLAVTVSTVLLAGTGCTATKANSSYAAKYKSELLSPASTVCGSGESLGEVMSASSGDSEGLPAGAPLAIEPLDKMRIATFSPGSSNVSPAIPAPGRLMTFDATISLAVADIRASAETIITMVKNNNGYIQEQSGNTLVLKIPAASLEKVIAALEKIGRITNKSLKAEDVTEIMFDLKTRIDNLENLRTRLLALLDKATKVEDMIRIETELARITKELELYKGRQRLMAGKITYSTLTVQLISQLPQQQVQRIIPIAWVKDLGTEITRQEAFTSGSGTYRPFNYPLPDGFVIVEYNDDVILYAIAASPEGLTLEMNIVPGIKDAKPEFWHKLIRRALTEVNAYRIVSDVDVATVNKLPCFKIEAVKEVGGKNYTYVITVMVDDEKLYLVECWGETTLFESSRKAFEASLPQMQPWKWWQRAY